MTIPNDLFADLEVLIRWGSVDPIRQEQLFSILQANPSLARELDEYGTSLLMVAADAGNTAAIEALCKLCADVNALSDGGETPLVNAIRREPQTPIDRKANHDAVQILLAHGADPNLIGFQGCSALHWAVIEGDPRIVEILLRHKGNIALCTSDRDQETVLDILQSGRFRGTVTQREVIAKLIAQHAPQNREKTG